MVQLKGLRVLKRL